MENLFPYSFYCADYGEICDPLTGGTPGVAKSIPQKVCSNAWSTKLVYQALEHTF